MTPSFYVGVLQGGGIGVSNAGGEEALVIMEVRNSSGEETYGGGDGH
jgi:hypothetical protein